MNYPVCKVCGFYKKAIGRDAREASGLCWPSGYHGIEGCEGYWDDPKPLNTWPNEQQERERGQE